MADTKKQSLDTALKQIESQFGKGTIMKLGTRETIEVPSIPTGSFGLDNALGIGGCLLYTSPSPRDTAISRMPSSA